MNARDGVAYVAAASSDLPDFDTIFHENYTGIARAVARVIGDPSRAEDIAIEAFWRLWRHPEAIGERSGGWVRRTAVRLALDELRRRSRRARYETLLVAVRWSPRRPDQVLDDTEEQRRVRAVLAAIHPRQAELLLLQSDGATYDEIAVDLALNPASIGTLLARARTAFRKEYVTRYGDQ